jgi:hypothetical protein
MTKSLPFWLIFATVLALALVYAPSAAYSPESTVEAKIAAPEVEIATTTVATSSKPSSVEGLIEWYADIHGAPHDQAYWIARCESDLKNVPNRNGSIYGQGVYQFIPSSWSALCEGDVWDIEDNISCGTRLIGEGQLHHWGTAYTDWGSYQCWRPHVTL